MENGTDFHPVFPYRVARKSAEEKAEEAAAAAEDAEGTPEELAAAAVTVAPTEAPTEAPKLNEDGEEEFVFNLPTLPDPKREPPFFEGSKTQLIKPETAYVLTSLLKGVVDEAGGTGRRAAALGRPVAGKTGSTSNYYDAWFLGYTADIAAGVWVGYDEERSLGKGEVGGRSALPIWVEYMKTAHGNTPARDFPVPEGIVFASIDNETGRLASAKSKEVVRQAFAEGTEPKDVQNDPSSETNTETIDFFKEDLAE
jgi:membrane carboxypeptidase/penicillin-binding protein